MKILTLYAVFVLFASLWLLSPIYSQVNPNSVETQGTLILGDREKRELSPGILHVWNLALEAGQYTVVEVEQKGIDVVVRLVDPRGIQKGRYDSSGRAAGAEKAAWIADIVGTWKIKIEPFDVNQTGDYEIECLVLREASAADQLIWEADSLNNLAQLYRRTQGKYIEAEPLYQRALAIREKVFGPQHLDVAQSLNNLAALYYTQGKYAAAEPLFKRALAIREEDFGTEHPSVAASLNNLAMAYYIQSKYTDAERLYQRALTINEKIFGAEYPRSLAPSLNNLAALYYNQGKYAAAEPLLKRALAIREKAYGAEDPDVAQSLNNLAELYGAQGKYADAEPLYRRALAIDEKAFGPEHHDVATRLNNLGDLYYNQGKYAAAEPLFKRALAIYKKVFGTEHPRLAWSLNNLASLYQTQGKYADAEPLYKRALVIYKKVFGAEHPDVAQSLSDLAHLYYRQGKARKADSSYSLAIKIFDQTTAMPKERISAYLGRARLGKERGQIQEAIADLNIALSAIENQRPQIGGDEALRATFIEKHSNAFDLMATWQIGLGQVKEAFETVERGRARALLDQLEMSRVDWRAAIPEDVLAPLEQRETAAQAKLAEYQQRISILRANKHMPDSTRLKQIAVLQDSLKIADQNYRGVYAEIKNASPVWRNQIGDIPDFNRLQRHLVTRNRLLLQYQLGPDQSHVIVVPPPAREPYALPLLVGEAAAKVLGVDPGPLKSSHLQQSVVETDLAGTVYINMLQQLSRARSLPPGTRATPAYLAQLHALWRVIVPDILWQQLQSCDVILIPDGALHLLPFAALVVQLGTGTQETKFWLDQGPMIRYNASATSLYSISRRPDPRRIPSQADINVLSISNPVYDVTKVIAAKKQLTSTDAVATLTNPAESLVFLTRGAYESSGGVLIELPGTAAETAAIERAFTQNGPIGKVKTLQKLKASEGNLRHNVTGKRYLHLATHGLVNHKRKSLFSALAFTPPVSGQPSSDDDGFLQLHEIYELDLDHCELAVLSACKTNVGEYIDGEGVFALSRGFLVAGARRVIASQWSVNDASTAALMRAFFTQIAKAEKHGTQIDYARVLRDAKLAVRKHWADPFYWAPFVLMGKG